MDDWASIFVSADDDNGRKASAVGGVGVGVDVGDVKESPDPDGVADPFPGVDVAPTADAVGVSAAPAV
jgi:hypothetical protein